MAPALTLRFTSVGAPDRHFDSFDEAMDFGKDAGFDFSLWRASGMVASWSVFGGLKRPPARRTTGTVLA